MDLQNSMGDTQAKFMLQLQPTIKSVAQGGILGSEVFFCKFRPIGTTVRSYMLVWQNADFEPFRSVIDCTIRCRGWRRKKNIAKLRRTCTLADGNCCVRGEVRPDQDPPGAHQWVRNRHPVAYIGGEHWAMPPPPLVWEILSDRASGRYFSRKQ